MEKKHAVVVSLDAELWDMVVELSTFYALEPARVVENIVKAFKAGGIDHTLMERVKRSGN